MLRALLCFVFIVSRGLLYLDFLFVDQVGRVFLLFEELSPAVTVALLMLLMLQFFGGCIGNASVGFVVGSKRLE